MGNCLSNLTKFWPHKRKITVLTIGLDNAGKTSSIRALTGDSNDDVVPTVGFSKASLRINNCHVTVFDLGGNSSIRGIWKKYFAEVHGIVFVVDSSAASRIEECKDMIHTVLSDPLIHGKPMLLLANKQDIEGALDEIDICDMMDLENLVNSNKTPTRVETCSSVTNFGNKYDKSIRSGFQWLIKMINSNWKSLSSRVISDLETQRQIDERKRKEQLDRVKKLREEREKDELNEQENDNHDDRIASTGDPFVPLDEIKNKLSKEDGKKHAKEEQNISKPKLNGGAVATNDHNEIFEINSSSEASILSAQTSKKGDFSSSAKSSRVASPSSKLITVTPKQTPTPSGNRLHDDEDNMYSTNWAPHVNSRNMKSMLSSHVSFNSSDFDGNTTTTVAQIERQSLNDSSNKISTLSSVVAPDSKRDVIFRMTPNGSANSAHSSHDESTSTKPKKRKKKNKFKSIKVVPMQSSTDESVTTHDFITNNPARKGNKLPPLKVANISNALTNDSLPIMSSFDMTKSSSDSADGRIQWELAEDLRTMNSRNEN